MNFYFTDELQKIAVSGELFSKALQRAGPARAAAITDRMSARIAARGAVGTSPVRQGYAKSLAHAEDRVADTMFNPTSYLKRPAGAVQAATAPVSGVTSTVLSPPGTRSVGREVTAPTRILPSANVATRPQTPAAEVLRGMQSPTAIRQPSPELLQSMRSPTALSRRPPLPPQEATRTIRSAPPTHDLSVSYAELQNMQGTQSNYPATRMFAPQKLNSQTTIKRVQGQADQLLAEQKARIASKAGTTVDPSMALTQKTNLRNLEGAAAQATGGTSVGKVPVGKAETQAADLKNLRDAAKHERWATNMGIGAGGLAGGAVLGSTFGSDRK